MASGLLQKLKPNNRVQQLFFRMVLYFALGICFWMFIRLFNDQRVRVDVKEKRQTMVRENIILDLNKITLSYFRCDRPYETTPQTLEECSSDPSLDAKQDSFQLLQVPEIKDPLGQSGLANWVKVVFELNEEEAAILRRSLAWVLIMPRNVHFATYVKSGDQFVKQFGYASDITFSFRGDELDETRKIEMYLQLHKNVPHIFGPTEFPAVLAKASNVRDYAGLMWMQTEANTLSKQFQLGIPLVLAAIAIVLDHSTVMSYLALYGASRAIHDYLGYKLDIRAKMTDFENYLYTMSCGFGFAFLVLFTAELFGLNIRRIKVSHRWIFVLLMGGVFAFGNKFDQSFITTSDLWGDSLSIAACFCVILYAGYEWFTNRNSADSKAGNPETYSRLSVALVVTRLTIVCVAFAIHGWVNVKDLIGVLSKEGIQKTPLDWTIMVLMPSLMTAALLEVGSTAKKMLNFGRDMAKKAIIEQELNVGREVQKRMIPSLESEDSDTKSWVWRAYYKPAEALAGDWFDIREVRFSDGQTLLAACVADVTGHGVGSSLATSVICSHWSLWCDKLSSGASPETPELKQSILRTAPHSIHLGLKALRENENCTAIFALFDPQRNEITFCSAGHPGIFCIGPKSFRYFTTQGERLGSDVLSDTVWNAKTEKLNGDELVVLYSDGVVPLRATVSSWAAQLKRKVTSGNVAVPEHLLVQQLRINKQGFRLDHDLVDDMTLVMVRRRSTEQKSEPVQPEVASEAASTQPQLTQSA